MLNWDIGIDLEKIDRFRRISKNRRFIRRFFTAEEISYCTSRGDPVTHFAGTFAAKEAVFKALNKHLQIDTRSFEILHEAGAPYVGWLGDKITRSRAPLVKISIAHSQTHAIAIAIAQLNDVAELPDLPLLDISKGWSKRGRTSHFAIAKTASNNNLHDS